MAYRNSVPCVWMETIAVAAAVVASFCRKRYERSAQQQQASHASQKQQQLTAVFSDVYDTFPNHQIFEKLFLHLPQHKFCNIKIHAKCLGSARNGKTCPILTCSTILEMEELQSTIYGQLSGQRKFT